MKILGWLSNNILFISTLFLLAFIPLYPKLPLLDIKNTWVYIRAEDLLIVVVLSVWIILILRRKITLQTPLTIPIMIFWITGTIATIHGVLLVFPQLANAFPNVAFLSVLRRVEYLSLFFIAFAAIKDKRDLRYVILILVLTLILVIGYGIGQKYFGFPAFLTMNEEFAKGIPIRLSSLSRVPSTFGGHYDLAAYLVLIIPIFVSLIFGLKNWLIRLFITATVFSAFVLLFMTVSRISFFVLLVTLTLLLFFQKKKFVLFSLPIVVIITFLFLSFSPLIERFGNTVKEIDVLVDADTGEAIGHIQLTPNEYFKNKVIKRKFYNSRERLGTALTEKEDPSLASPSALIAFEALSSQVILVSPPNVPTGENLPQGTGYINLSLSPVTKRLGEFFYENPVDTTASKSADVFVYSGNFLIKRASAYDLSFTTRFQGEWPRAIEAFKTNILIGSGYGSISLAIDNNYLRILGEVGLLGFMSFFTIFIMAGIYIKKVLPEVDSPLVRSFVLGFVAGVFGLMLNAVFIDVFEASKIAYLFWLLTGVTLGTLHLYSTNKIDLFREFKNVATSTAAIILYLFTAAIIIFSPMIGNFLVGDDFTWFRWAQDCKSATSCLLDFFTRTDGFFYRPGTKIYFASMYTLFWLNQSVYHLVSILLHFTVAALVFLLAKKILKDALFAVLASFLFLILSGYTESVFWISATGHLFNAVFILLSLLLFIFWEETKKIALFFASIASFILSLLFHELGLVTPLLIMAYKFSTDGQISLKIFNRLHYTFLFFPILPYLIIRFLAGSHGFSGDYSYNLLKLPLNIAGNIIGYLSLAFLGPSFLPFYQTVRSFSRENALVTIAFSLLIVAIFILAYRMIQSSKASFIERIDINERKIIIFTVLFFVLVLLPFLGLGNIASRYSYLASAAFVLFFSLMLKKLYWYLQESGKEIALSTIVLVISLFSLLHIIQLQQIHSDWYEAGRKTERFLVSIDGLYADYWAKERMQFHFVDIPIRHGEAWVFPVGLDDALWIVFRNPKISVYKWQTVEQALNVVEGSPNQKVLEFDETGRVIERMKTKDNQ